MALYNISVVHKYEADAEILSKEKAMEQLVFCNNFIRGEQNFCKNFPSPPATSYERSCTVPNDSMGIQLKNTMHLGNKLLVKYHDQFYLCNSGLNRVQFSFFLSVIQKSNDQLAELET